ncbi:MAG: glycosyltransferase family 4 protein [Butyrivibrio sp.]|nr:glycosyltransferase family 4 protein [Butyrivibrio sp.]
MNILLINHYAGSPDMGMEFRPYYLAKEWTKMGHKVSIIAGDYSHLRKNNPNIKHDMDKLSCNGVDYYWLKTGVYKNNGIHRALTMFRFCKKLNKWKKWIKTNLNPDVVISSSTYPLDALPAYSIAHKSPGKVKYIHEVHDMWPATLVEIGGMSKYNPFVMLMQYCENYAYKHADAVVSLPRYAKAYMMRHGLPEDKFYHIPNGIVQEEWNDYKSLPAEHRRVLKEIKNRGDFIVGYFGGHALSNCLMPLIKSAEDMQTENVHFVLVGKGVEKNSLVQYVNEHKIKNVSFLSEVNKRAVPELIKYFDATYIGAKDSPLYRFGVCMNKMFDCMMGGKPIIFGVNAPSTPVSDAECGIVIPPENSGEIKEAVRRLMKMNINERSAMGARGKEEIMEKYTYEKLAIQFANLF